MDLYYTTNAMTADKTFYYAVQADRALGFPFVTDAPDDTIALPKYDWNIHAWTDASAEVAEQKQAEAEKTAQEATATAEAAKQNLADTLMTVAQALQSGTIDETLKSQLTALYPEWTVGATYGPGDVVQHNGEIYNYIQSEAQVATEQLEPGVATYMWSGTVKTVDGDTVWVKPTGYDNAYKKGDVVLYSDGKYYQSQYDGNDQDPALHDDRYWVEVNKDGSPIQEAGE
ncbi:hypothetical protein [Lacticaseibacillus suihuaensis]